MQNVSAQTIIAQRSEENNSVIMKIQVALGWVNVPDTGKQKEIKVCI